MIKTLCYNWKIHRLLRRLAKQRVRVIHQPTNQWVIEYAVEESEENIGLIYTCQIRGWIELLHENVPSEQLGSDSQSSIPSQMKSKKHVWKLTDSGWAAIQRRHEITVLAVSIALLGIIVPIIMA
jgi:hypothetical protein